MTRLRLLLPALWAGVLLGVALLATPAPFAMLTPADAGRVAGRILAHEAYVSSALALVVVMVERRAGAAALGTNVFLALGALACTVAGYFAILPLMAAARAGQGALTFAQLHALSVAFYGVKTALVLTLAWRVSASARAS